MTELLNWNNIIVPQRNFTGCVPTGYEWLIRYLGIQGVDLATFQEEFDLGQNNSFTSIAAKIRNKYPTINIQTQVFPKGIDKVTHIKALIEKQTPCLISLALGKGQGWHIMPVVLIDDLTIEMIHDGIQGVNCIWKIPIKDIVWRHDNLQGGNDISWIDSALGATSSLTKVNSKEPSDDKLPEPYHS